MRRGTAVTLYLDQAVIDKLDREVERRAAADRANGLTGYSVTNRSKLATEIIEDYLVEWKGEDMTFTKISEIIKPVFQKYGVKSADLFGSYARGEQTPDSDIDIIVDRGPVRGLEFIGLQEELSAVLQKKVDLQPIDCMSERFLAKIQKDRVNVYAS